MNALPLDVVGVGNAIVDVIAAAADSELRRLGLEKGAMQLIDSARVHELYERMAAGVEVSGGSAANTLAGIASLGGRAAFIGKVRDDQFGEVFSHDLQAAGVEFRTRPATAGAPTGRSLIFVTPDAQRTMQTYLGVSGELGPDDIDPEVIGRARITYLEGYLFDKDEAKDAFIKAAEIAHAAGRKVALSLSDRLCVDRHRASFQDLVSRHVDILFANEAEITALFEVRDFDAATHEIQGHCAMAALTRGAEGATIVTAESSIAIAATPVARVIDTTGAGDLFAAGVLYGLSQRLELAACGRIGSTAAAEIISHYGARPETSLATLLAQESG